MEIKDLLKSRRLEKGLTMKEVADAVGVSEGTISRYESGDIANMKRSSIVALSKVLDIPPIRFITLDPIEEKVPSRQTRRIPLLGNIAAGAPIMADEHIEDYIEINLEIKADFVLKVKGDSMIDANIYDGDIVFIRQQPTVENGEIAAVMLIDPTTSDGVATLKRVYKTEDGMMLVAENKAYPPIIVNKETCDGAKILGKAVKCITDVR